MPKNRSKELSRACKKRKEKKSCMFTGVMSTREHRMRAPCAAAFGASRHKMVRCSQCAQPSWVCLDCWGAIADKTKSLTAERAKRARKLKLMQHPVYDALAGGVDFKQLSADAAAGRSVAAGTTEGGGVLMKDCNGEWCWQEAGCPMCVDFPFPEPKPSLSLAASLAMPNVLLSLTETGSICGCSAVGHQHMQQVSDQQAAILTLSVKLHPSPTLNPNRTLPPSTPDQNPLQIKVHVYVLGDVLTAEEEEATVSRLLDANARVRLFHEHQNHYSGASRLATVQVYQVLMRMLMHTHMHNMHMPHAHATCHMHMHVHMHVHMHALGTGTCAHYVSRLTGHPEQRLGALPPRHRRQPRPTRQHRRAERHRGFAKRRGVW